MMKRLLNKILSLFYRKEETIIDNTREEEIVSEKEYKITKDELLEKGDPIAPEHQAAFNEYHKKINIFRDKCGLSMSPTSYYRSKERQRRIYKDKAKKKEWPFENGIYDESKVPMSSKHMTGYACDFADSNKKLAKWVLANIDWCKENGFYFENFGANIKTYKEDKSLDKTPSWIHIQTIPPKSGNIIFNP